MSRLHHVFSQFEIISLYVQALDSVAPFDEFQVLTDYIPHLQRSLGMENISVQRHPTGAPIDSKDGPFPLQPKIVLLTE